MAIKIGDGVLDYPENSSYFVYGFVVNNSDDPDYPWVIKFCDQEEYNFSREMTNHYRNAFKKMMKDVKQKE